MKKSSLIIGVLFCLAIVSCKKDDTVICTTCSSAETLSFQLCEETDGNASVNGENTGTAYEIYITDLQASGVECGK